MNEEEIVVSPLQKKHKGNEESKTGELSQTPTLRFNIPSLSKHSIIPSTNENALPPDIIIPADVFQNPPIQNTTDHQQKEKELHELTLPAGSNPSLLKFLQFQASVSKSQQKEILSTTTANIMTAPEMSVNLQPIINATPALATKDAETQPTDVNEPTEDNTSEHLNSLPITATLDTSQNNSSTRQMKLRSSITRQSIADPESSTVSSSQFIRKKKFISESIHVPYETLELKPIYDAIKHCLDFSIKSNNDSNFESFDEAEAWFNNLGQDNIFEDANKIMQKQIDENEHPRYNYFNLRELSCTSLMHNKPLSKDVINFTMLCLNLHSELLHEDNDVLTSILDK